MPHGVHGSATFSEYPEVLALLPHVAPKRVDIDGYPAKRVLSNHHEALQNCEPFNTTNPSYMTAGSILLGVTSQIDLQDVENHLYRDRNKER